MRRLGGEGCFVFLRRTDDRSKNVAGTWIRFMTKLATEMGMVLAS